MPIGNIIYCSADPNLVPPQHYEEIRSGKLLSLARCKKYFNANLKLEALVSNRRMIPASAQTLNTMTNLPLIHRFPFICQSVTLSLAVVICTPKLNLLIQLFRWQQYQRMQILIYTLASGVVKKFRAPRTI